MTAAPTAIWEERDVDVFELRDDLIDDYREYATSFMRIRDERIRDACRPRRSTTACSGRTRRSA